MAVNRHTRRFWREAAISFICDITDQVPLPGDGDDILRMSKLRRDEAGRMLEDLVGALQVERDDALLCLAEAWRERRDAKAARYGWYDSPPEAAAAGRRPPKPRRVRKTPVPSWRQADMFAGGGNEKVGTREGAGPGHPDQLVADPSAARGEGR